MHIPYFFLSNNLFSRPDDTVLDPFCGSGTVLLEAILARRNAIGCDTNPLATLIARVKTHPLDPQALSSSITRLLRRIRKTPLTSPPEVINLQYWFHPHVIRQLTTLLEAIDQTRNPHFKEFFEVCFSVCVRKVSLADPRLSVPVKLRLGQYPTNHWLHERTNRHVRKLAHVDVVATFQRILKENFHRMTAFNDMMSSHHIGRAHVHTSDARQLVSQGNDSHRRQGIPTQSVDLVITSPPYAGAQKYIRASSLSLGWLELARNGDLRKLDEMTVGREFFRKVDYENPITIGISSADIFLEEIYSLNPLRSHIAGTYLLEMKDVLREVSRVLKPRGHLILILANNNICGREFKATRWLTRIAEEFHLSLILRFVDSIRSRGLMTKRNKTASMITREWVLVFRRNDINN
jgi:DNA modification methylase